MSGQARIRVRYKKYVTPWIEFFMVSQGEMKTLLKGTGWCVRQFFDGRDGLYIAIIEKERGEP
jgi:hypothetical protein